MHQLLAPNEHLAGTPGQRRDLLAYLTMVRDGPPVSQLCPELSCTTLARLLTAPPPFLDEPLLHAGLTLAAQPGTWESSWKPPQTARPAPSPATHASPRRPTTPTAPNSTTPPAPPPPSQPPPESRAVSSPA